MWLLMESIANMPRLSLRCIELEPVPLRGKCKYDVYSDCDFIYLYWSILALRSEQHLQPKPQTGPKTFCIC